MQFATRDLLLDAFPFNHREEKFYSYKERVARSLGVSTHVIHNFYYNRRSLSNMERILLESLASARQNNHIHITELQKFIEENPSWR